MQPGFPPRLVKHGVFQRTEWAFAAGSRFHDDALLVAASRDPSVRWLARYEKESDQDALDQGRALPEPSVRTNTDCSIYLGSGKRTRSAQLPTGDEISTVAHAASMRTLFDVYRLDICAFCPCKSSGVPHFPIKKVPKAGVFAKCDQRLLSPTIRASAARAICSAIASFRRRSRRVSRSKPSKYRFSWRCSTALRTS
jgi:hypothetical protein